jgi:hypothetical protein
VTVAINGTALIRHAATQVDYRIEAEELDWDQVGGDEEQMGPRLQFAAEIDHPDLGLLSWEAWEYPVGILDDIDQNIGPHQLIENFDFSIEFEPDEPDSEDEDSSLTAEERKSQIDAMVEWFHANFEDPANRLPYVSAEGGYQWVNGGPFDAREEVESNFPDAPQGLIEAAVDEIQSDGLFDWASKDFSDFDDGDLDDATQAPDFDDDDEEDVSVESLMEAVAAQLAGGQGDGSVPKFGRDELGRLDFQGWPEPADLRPPSPLLAPLREAAQRLVQSLAGTNAHINLLRAAQNYEEVLRGDTPSIGGAYARGVMLENAYRHSRDLIEREELPPLPNDAPLAADDLIALHGAFVMNNPDGQALVEGAAAYQMPERTIEAFERAATRFATEIQQATALFSPATQTLVADAVQSVGTGPHSARSRQVAGLVIGGLAIGIGHVLGETGMSILVDGFKASALGAGAVQAAAAGYNTLFNFVAAHLHDINTIIAATGTDAGWLSPLSRLIQKLRRQANEAAWGG